MERVLRRHAPRRLFARTLVVSLATLASRLLGFVREILAAMLFGGHSGIFDAFVTAWRVPNLFRRFLGEGALSTSLQTALTEVDGDEGDEAGRRLFLRTVRLTAWVLVALCAAVMVAVPLLPDALAGPKVLGADADVVRELVVRVAPFVVLICLSALSAGALQVRGRYGAPALAPVAMNATWIATLIYIGVRFSWEAPAGLSAAEADARQLEMARVLAWGVLVAGAVQLAVQVPALRSAGLLTRRPEEAARADVRGGDSGRTAFGVLRDAAPLALGAAVYQINVMIDGLMAEGWLADGGPTAHYLANRVQQFPMALIAIAATSSVFPALKAMGHAGHTVELRALLDRTQLAIAFLALPASVGLAVLAWPLTLSLFAHGAFDVHDAGRVAAALRMLALAILPAGAAGLVARAYYARGDFRTPVRVSCAMLVTNALLNAVFVLGLGMDADGLALATAITSVGNVALLLPGLTKRLGLPVSELAFFPRLVRQLVAALVCGVVAAGVWHALAPADIVGGSKGVVLATSAAIAAGALAFAGSAKLLDVDEMTVVTDRLRARFRTSNGVEGDRNR